MHFEGNMHSDLMVTGQCLEPESSLSMSPQSTILQQTE